MVLHSALHFCLARLSLSWPAAILCSRCAPTAHPRNFLATREITRLRPPHKPAGREGPATSFCCSNGGLIVLFDRVRLWLGQGSNCSIVAVLMLLDQPASRSFVAVLIWLGRPRFLFFCCCSDVARSGRQPFFCCCSDVAHPRTIVAQGKRRGGPDHHASISRTDKTQPNPRSCHNP